MHILSKLYRPTSSGSGIGLLSKASERGLTTVKQLRDSKNIGVTDRLEKMLNSPEAEGLACSTKRATFISRTKVK